VNYVSLAVPTDDTEPIAPDQAIPKTENASKNAASSDADREKEAEA